MSHAPSSLVKWILEDRATRGTLNFTTDENIKYQARLHTLNPHSSPNPNPTSRLGATYPFDKVFASMGTPLSDATEEKHWRKLVQRAINVRNRFPIYGPPALARNGIQIGHECRLCGSHTESMLGLFQCTQTSPYWKACMKFTREVLKAPNSPNVARAIILGLWTPTELGPEDARAFLRHAFGAFYKDFAKVDILKTPFVWEATFLRAILSFQNAIGRRAQQIRYQYIRRTYSSLKNQVPREERERYPNLAKIDPTGILTLSPTFTTARAAASRANEDRKTADSRITQQGAPALRP
jgi:hypothetical protein